MPGMPMPLPDRVRRLCHGVALPWLAFTVVVYVFAFIGGFVQTWGRDYTPTLAHFATAFDLQWGEFGLVWAGTAWNSLFTTVKLAAIAAPICAALGLLISWLLARTQFVGQRCFEFGALLAFAIPGTVLGVSYILAFNVPPFELTGTALIIVLCFVFRNLPVGVRAGTASFKQLDKSLDEASTMLRAGTATTLRRVVLPLLKPALVAALVYSFVRSMTTVSAVVFLVTAENELATTYIIGRVGNGDYGVALAYCTVLIVLMSAGHALIQFLVGERKLGRRWHARTLNHVAGIEFRRSPSATATPRAAGRQGCRPGRAQGHADHHPGAVGLRQDHAAAHDRGAGCARGGHHPDRRPGRHHLGPAERNVSMVFQSYALFPHMNVMANVGYGLSVTGVSARTRPRAVPAPRWTAWAWPATTSACPAN
jgi:ABC-type spermidine/putrescine transport system permease subunit II